MRRSILSRFSIVVAALFCLAVGDIPSPAVSTPIVRADEQTASDTPAAEPRASNDKIESDKPENIAPLFMRVVRNDAGEATFLETAVVGYVPAEGADKDKVPADLQVDLIGVVHIGDKAYYDALNTRFGEYDALLYELVAPEGTEVKKSEERGANMHPVAALQYGLKSMLDLEFQLDCIDYGKANFVHADMSPDEFAASMKRKGESFTQMYFRLLGASIAQQSAGGNSPGNLQTMLALFSNDRTWKLKRLFAEQFEGSGGAMSAFEGADGSTIIAERNKKAFEVLRAQIDAGKRRIGVFYGAGHLADMEKRLEEDFSLRREKEEWLPAWSLQPPKE